MNEVTLKLSAEEYRHLIAVLAELPNRSNTYNLVVSLETQVKALLEAAEVTESLEGEVI